MNTSSKTAPTTTSNPIFKFDVAVLQHAPRHDVEAERVVADGFIERDAALMVGLQLGEGNTGNHGGGVFAWGGKACEKAQIAAKRPLCQRITGTDWKKVLANRWNRKRIAKKGPRWSWARNQMGNVSLIGTVPGF